MSAAESTTTMPLPHCDHSGPPSALPTQTSSPATTRQPRTSTTCIAGRRALAPRRRRFAGRTLSRRTLRLPNHARPNKPHRACARPKHQSSPYRGRPYRSGADGLASEPWAAGRAEDRWKLRRQGRTFVQTVAEALSGWHKLSSSPSPARAIKRALVNHDTHYMLACVARDRPIVIVQRFVAGQDANAAAAC
jgi:hypothetical protein